MGKSHRPQRLAEEIKKIIGDMLLRGRLKDPRFAGMIAVSAVEVSGDGSYATLYITAMPFDPSAGFGEEEKKGILEAFERSSGYIRSEIGKKLHIRYAPELIFRFDQSFEYGDKMDRLLDSLDIKPAAPDEAQEDEEEDEYR
ncbi:MAG: 30S ribosome-binding factor RbfA [Firmicutes bacterium]|nr:30S ribosome-binding factor RbfA [Bacillota bacterium]MBQ4372384.1 30S ribosome-binding factor RbfA [Bacillota bacterium]